jgi:hypothetical protein
LTAEDEEMLKVAVGLHYVLRNRYNYTEWLADKMYGKRPAQNANVVEGVISQVRRGVMKIKE